MGIALAVNGAIEINKHEAGTDNSEQRGICITALNEREEQKYQKVIFRLFEKLDQWLSDES